MALPRRQPRLAKRLTPGSMASERNSEMTNSTKVPFRRAHTKRSATVTSAPAQKMIVAGITHCGIRVPAMTGPEAGSGRPESTGSLSAPSSVTGARLSRVLEPAAPAEPRPRVPSSRWRP